MSTLASRVRSMADSVKTPRDIGLRLSPKRRQRRPRILIVTPELNSSDSLRPKVGQAPRAKAGGLADVCTLLVDFLADKGVDVHVAMPHFRRLFRDEPVISRRLHLCQDREFYYRRSVYEGEANDNRRAALVFQRDVIHHVLPQVRPDLVHCHDWMTGLVPAAAAKMGIKSLFTIHNLHDERATLAEIEDRGIDAAGFWDRLHFEHFPESYERARSSNPVGFLTSAIHAAGHVNTVSPSFLSEMMDGIHPGADRLAGVLRAGYATGRVSGIVNAPAASWSPEADPALIETYDAQSFVTGKAVNKMALQQALGLEVNPDAPMFFWPSRLDPVQKGCQLLAEILYRTVSDYSRAGLQVVFVADGPFKVHFENIVHFHGLYGRVAVAPFCESMSRQAFAASDFVLMPSLYEPCGLSQMVGLRYGSLPVVHRTGGLRDTVSHLDPENGLGNGFVFENHDANGLRWAMDEAMRFHCLSRGTRDAQVRRIMEESAVRFSPSGSFSSYGNLYECLLERSLG